MHPMLSQYAIPVALALLAIFALVLIFRGRSSTRKSPASRTAPVVAGATSPRPKTAPRTPAPRSGAPPRGPGFLRLLPGGAASADRIAIVGFSDKSYIILPPTLMSEAGVRTRIDQLTGKYFRNPGLTNLAAGMEQALSFLEKAPRGVLRRMVVIGDGEPNIGNDRLVALADRARNSHVSICTIFAGQGNAPIFQSVSDKTVGGWKTSVSQLADLAGALRRAGANLGAGRSRRRAIIVVVIDMSASMTASLAGEPGVTRIEACRRALHAMLDWHAATYGVKVAA